MKIMPKLQSGGGMPPLTYYTPITTPEVSDILDKDLLKAPDTTTTSSTKGEVTNKDLLEMVEKIDGLPNDLATLFEELMKYYKFENLYKNGRINTTNLSSRYLATLNKMKVINFNKLYYDEAKKKVTEAGGLGEVAITDSGKVVVQNRDGEISLISSLEYLRNKDKYQPLTNSNLLYLRAHNPDFSFSNEIFGVVENGIGISAITKMIEDAIGKLEVNEVSKEGYSYKKADLITKGLEILREASERGISLEGMSLDGMYKSKLITKDLYLLASLAIQYVYNTLPSNAHTLLEIRSGNMDNPQKGALDLITKLVMSRTGTTNTLELDFQEDLNEDGSSKKENKNEIQSNPLLNIVEGKGGERGAFELNTGNSVKMSVDGVNYTPLSMTNNLPIKETSLENLLVNSGLMGIISLNGAMTFGDLILDPSDLKNIVYRGKGVSRVILPTRYVEGKYIPDFTIMDEYLDALKEINKIPKHLSKEELERQQGEILYKYGLLELLDPSTGLPNLDRFRVFIATDAYGADKDDLIKGSPLVEEVDEDSRIYLDIEKILSTKDNPYELNKNWNLSWGSDKIYRGVVYIPINNNKLQSITAYGDLVKETTAAALETDYLQFIKKLGTKSTSASVL